MNMEKHEVYGHHLNMGNEGEDAVYPLREHRQSTLGVHAFFELLTLAVALTDSATIHLETLAHCGPCAL